MLVLVLLAVAVADIPAFPDSATYADLSTGWNRINPSGSAPGAATICSDGGDFNFWFYKTGAATRKLFIEFEGGGACWDYDSCSFDGLFNRNLEAVRNDFNTPSFLSRGSFLKNASNPLYDYDHMFIPYCTGDLHLGDIVRNYADDSGNTRRVEHMGRFNVEWAYGWLMKGANMPVPIAVHINGCSAGGYGAIVYSAETFRQFKALNPGVILTQFGDSAAGVGSEDFGYDLKHTWSAWDALPAFIPAVKEAMDEGRSIAFEELYKWVSEYFPNAAFSQFNTEKDYIQYFFWQLMVMPREVTDDEWNVEMDRILTRLTALNNVQEFRATGNNHCILTRDYYYTERGTGPVEGVLFTDWLSNFLNGPTTYYRMVCDYVIKLVIVLSTLFSVACVFAWAFGIKVFATVTNRSPRGYSVA